MQNLYQVVFVSSANVPAAFVSTESGQMEYLLEDKLHEEKGTMCIVSADGTPDYHGELKRISGRGNSTWMRYDKKPYAIRLPAAASLCGMEAGEKWCLLAMFREGSKMSSRLALDMAEELGLAYTSQGTWIDLYLNGEYAGIYLLTEAVTVGEARVEIQDLEEQNLRSNQEISESSHFEEADSKGYEIADGGNLSGGYLLEKDSEAYYEEEACGFITPQGSHFSIKSPKHISREQVTYLSSYVGALEQKIMEKDPAVWEYLDLESFAARLLLDEISMDYDACVTSMFFYKEQDDPLLYSGPVWDYDIAFGGVNADSADGRYVDYMGSIVYGQEERGGLFWYGELYEQGALQEALREAFEKLVPFCREMLETGLDAYADYIRASVSMDAVRWREKREYAGWYEDYDANVAYLRFFVANRMNVIGERLDAEFTPFQVPASGEVHTVSFWQDGREVMTLQAEDGALLTQEALPSYDETLYEGWRYQWGREKFRETIPVYDDMILYNERRQDDS